MIDEEELAEIERKIKNDEYDANSLSDLYKALFNILSWETPEIAEQVLSILKEGSKSEKNDTYTLKRAYDTLDTIVRRRPELAEQAFSLFAESLKSDKNDADSLRSAYETLDLLVQDKPELTAQVLSALTEGLKSEKNDCHTLESAYDTLGIIAQNKSKLAEQALSLFAESLKSEKNDTYTLKRAYSILGTIVRRRPELAEQAFSLFAESLKSDKNDADSLGRAYHELGDIAQGNPKLTAQVLSALTESLKSDKNDADSLRSAYDTLGTIVRRKPEIAEQVLSILKEGSKSEKNDTYTLKRAYSILGTIVRRRPELAEQAFSLFAESLKSDKNDADSLRSAYETLGTIVQDKPELTAQVLSALTESLKSDKNDADSLRSAYDTLGIIAQNKPELTAQVLSALTEGLKSEKNDWHSRDRAYIILGTIVRRRPELAEQALSTLTEGLKSEKNNENSLYFAYSTLDTIVQAKPELADQTFQLILTSPHPSENNQTRIPVMAQCLRKCRAENFTIPEDLQSEVVAAQKLRFSKPEEIKYALETMSLDKIANHNFGIQQRCLNTLIGLTAVEKGISAEETKQFRQGKSTQMNELFTTEKDWLVPASFKAAEIFGSWLPNYMDKTKGYFSVHDAVYWLPEGMSKTKNESLSLFLRNNVIYDKQGTPQARPLEELSIISRSWKCLKPEEEKLPYKDLLAVCQSKKYENQKYDEFAVQAAKFGYSEKDYKNIESIYDAGLDVPEPFDNSKKFTLGNYTGRFLPRDDARVGFFGDYTDCCQHFGGVGEACAISSIMDPYSQLFVIENEKGRIIAGSWVWENTEGKYREACFDNIEAIGEYKKKTEFNRIYEQAAHYMCDEANCKRVTIGLGCQDADTSSYKKTEAIPLPKLYGNRYSDARSQVLLQENPKAQPLDKTKESQRYIRNVCFLDLKAMDKISEQCFPEGDRALQTPDNLSGKVLVDKDKGVVGYCLYDTDEKHIYDMAVLPEYRKDSNASSGKLFLEVSKEITQQGGEWTLEARESTTYRYLQMMQFRGMIKMSTQGVDHTMSDGSNVYNVKFSVTDRKSQTKTKNQEQTNNDTRTINILQRTRRSERSA